MEFCVCFVPQHRKGVGNF